MDSLQGVISLATGSRISEIHALRREPEFLALGDNDLTLISRFSFLAKNENPIHRRDPIVIPRLFDEDGSPHVLCPVYAIEKYLACTPILIQVPSFCLLRTINLGQRHVPFHYAVLSRSRSREYFLSASR